MANDPTIRTVSSFTKALLVVLGFTLILVAMGVITVDPNQVRTAPAVLLATGVLFVVLGVLALVQPRQARYPQAFRFLLALLTSSGATLVGLVTLYSHDERLFIGPFVFSGPAVDAFGKVVLGLDALFLGAAALWCWRRWWQQRGPATG